MAGRKPKVKTRTVTRTVEVPTAMSKRWFTSLTVLFNALVVAAAVYLNSQYGVEIPADIRESLSPEVMVIAMGAINLALRVFKTKGRVTF